VRVISFARSHAPLLVVGRECVSCPSSNGRYLHRGVDDLITADISQHFPDCTRFIGTWLPSDERMQSVLLTLSRGSPAEASARDGQCVLVHCAMGVSRSSTIVLAYLVQCVELFFLRPSFAGFVCRSRHAISCEPIAGRER
jgi:hypothetical protein